MKWYAVRGWSRLGAILLLAICLIAAADPQARAQRPAAPQLLPKQTLAYVAWRTAAS